MPIGIDAYKAMTMSSSQLAILQGDDGKSRIGKASDGGTNFLQRLFNTGASKKVNIEIANDFKSSMIAAYGRKVTDEVLSRTIGSKGLTGAKLSTDLVKRSIDEAEKIIARRLDIPRTSAAKVSLRIEGVRYDIALSSIDDQQKAVLGAAQAQIALLNDLLMELPTDTMALGDFSERMDKAKTGAQTLLANELRNLSVTGDAAVARDAAAGALTRLLDLADSKLAEAQEVCQKNPLTYKALADFAGKYVDSAVKAVGKLNDGNADFGLGEDKGEMAKIMSKLTAPDGLLKMLAAGADVSKPPLLSQATPEQLNEIRKALPDQGPVSGQDVCPNPKEYLGKSFATKIAAFCVAIAKQELAKLNPPLDGKLDADAFASAVSRATSAQFGQDLNDANWDPISKNVTFSIDGKSCEAKSVITPASRMGGAVGKLYEDGRSRGYNSHSFGEKTHAVNLAQSKFEIDVNGTPKTVFSGIRHGVHAAVDITDEAEFKAANASRAKEALIAAFTSRPDLVDVAKNNPDTPVKFQFTSVSLLTPDRFRGMLNDRHNDEKRMLLGQTEAYRSLNGQVIEVEIPVTSKDASGNDVTTMKKVKIQPQVTLFNYGVNFGGVGFLSQILGGWGTSGEVNGQSLSQITRFGSEALTRLAAESSRTTDPVEKKKIQSKRIAIADLLTQIWKMDAEKSYKSDGHEAYKMASRIAVLTYLAGGVPAWNCKSGKDRTGMMDAECKFLSTLIELGHRIPEPGAELTTEERLLYRNILLQGGNHEMQQYNTGIAGYKLQGVSSIGERIGDADAHKVFLGGSKVVHS